ARASRNGIGSVRISPRALVPRQLRLCLRRPRTVRHRPQSIRAAARRGQCAGARSGRRLRGNGRATIRLRRYAMTNLAGLAVSYLRLMTAAAVVFLSQCVDLTPTVVAENNDAASGSTGPACLACILAADEPGPGCGSELTACGEHDPCLPAFQCA